MAEIVELRANVSVRTHCVSVRSPFIEAYCSDYCSDADNAGELGVQSDCKHRACVLE